MPAEDVEKTPAKSKSKSKSGKKKKAKPKAKTKTKEQAEEKRKRKSPPPAASSASSSSSSSATVNAAKKHKSKGADFVVSSWEEPASEEKHNTPTPHHDDNSVIPIKTIITLITLITLIPLICQELDNLVSTEGIDFSHFVGSGDEEKEEVGSLCVVCDDEGASKYTCKICQGAAHEGCAVSADDPDDDCSVVCLSCSPDFSRGVGGNHGAESDVKDACCECGNPGASTHVCRGCDQKVHGQIQGCSVNIHDPKNEMAALCMTCKVAADSEESPEGATCCVCKKRGKGPLYDCYNCKKVAHSGIQGCSGCCHTTGALLCNNCK